MNTSYDEVVWKHNSFRCSDLHFNSAWLHLTMLDMMNWIQFNTSFLWWTFRSLLPNAIFLMMVSVNLLPRWTSFPTLLLALVFILDVVVRGGETNKSSIWNVSLYELLDLMSFNQVNYTFHIVHRLQTEWNQHIHFVVSWECFGAGNLTES